MAFFSEAYLPCMEPVSVFMDFGFRKDSQNSVIRKRNLAIVLKYLLVLITFC